MMRLPAEDSDCATTPDFAAEVVLRRLKQGAPAPERRVEDDEEVRQAAEALASLGIRKDAADEEELPQYAACGTTSDEE
eukprot:489768-Ditylum_brightwellii.AAC.1